MSRKHAGACSVWARGYDRGGDDDEGRRRGRRPALVRVRVSTGSCGAPAGCTARAVRPTGDRWPCGGGSPEVAGRGPARAGSDAAAAG